MNINGTEVKQRKTESGINYEYFACSCKEVDKIFLDKLLANYRENPPVEVDYVTSSVFFDLMAEGWYVTSIFADQWAEITLANEEHKDTMRIQCDVIEHGLAIAATIVEQLSANLLHAKSA